MRASKLFLALLILCIAPGVLAQNACPAIIAAALESVDTACNQTTRNQLCYGNIALNATPREGVADFQFEQSGDLVGIADVETLQLSSFSLTDEEWGVALMKLQANLPETLPGQNVTFLLFGDVTMTDAGDQLVELPVTATGGVNVRLRPSTDASVILALRNGQEVIATGRLPDNSWIRIRLDNASVGWVSADFLNGDLRRLLTAESSAPAFAPMQAFYFTTGVGDAPCAEAPDSGILIQTPKGVGEIRLRANNVDIRIGSTVYLQATPGDAISVSVIEGHAMLSALGESQLVPAGTIGRVPLDASGVASGAPEYPEPYDDAALQVLPLDIALPEAVAVENGVPETEIPAAIDMANGLPPLSGRWIHTETNTQVPPLLCFGETGLIQGMVSNMSAAIVFSEDRSTMALPVPNTVTLYRTGESSYSGRHESGVWELTFTSPTSYQGRVVGWPENPECSWDRDISGVYQP